MTYVANPAVRYHPAVVAQQDAFLERAPKELLPALREL
jgi:hypothetical protein